MTISRVALLLLCCFWTITANAKITVMTEDFAPFGFYDETGKLTGIGVEIVTELMAKLDVEDEIQVLPWSRAMKELEIFPNRALFCVARTPARNDKFEWVGPLLSDGVYLFHTDKFDSTGQDLESAKGWPTIAVTANYPEHQTLTQLGFENLWVTNQPKENARLLQYGRVTAMAAGEFAMPSLIESQDLNSAKVVNSGIRLFDIDLYIAFSKGTSQKVLDEWQQALTEFQTSPKYQEIRQRYTVSE